MDDAPVSDLVDELLQRARAALRDPAALALAGAAATTADDDESQSHGLAVLGCVAALHGRAEEGLELLRRSFAVQSDERARLALLVLATAVRCGQGDQAQALKLGRLVEAATCEPRLLRLLARLYLSAAEDEDPECLAERAAHCLALADLEEAFVR